jgi:hypothetical protein
MLRTYYYKNIFSHAFNQTFGFIILMGFGYITYIDLLGLKSEYNVINDINDSLSFISLFLVMIAFLFQASKSFIMYVPSTYLHFNDEGVSFRKFKKEIQFFKWEEIRKIELEVQNEWLLNLFIIKNDGEIIRVILTELWLLSFSRKLCVSHNFLKLIAIANKNSNLMTKLDSDEIKVFYDMAIY